MIELYKFISEEELLEIGEKRFREFSSNFPLCFYLNKSFDQNIDEKLIFLVKCKIAEIDFLNFKNGNSEEVLITPEKLKDFNHSLIDKIKIDNVFGKDLQNIENEKAIAFLGGEQRFFEWRLRIFLDKNTREIIPYNYFKREEDECEELSPEDNMEKIKAEIDEETKSLKKKKEITFQINSVEEAVNYLINDDLDEEDIKNFKNKSCAARLEYFGENFGFHFGYGMYLRNLFFHGNKNQQFLDDLKKYKSNNVLDSGEFGEGIIYDLLWRKLNSCETSQENAMKVQNIQMQIENGIDDDSYWNLYITMKLLLYNFTEDEIKKQLELEKKMDDDSDNFEEYYFQQKALLARLNKDEKEIFENLKQDYFNIKNIVVRLKKNHE